MSRITPSQIDTIKLAHADGCLDQEIAASAGVSLATVKRYRSRLSLETNCPTNRLGKLGERLVAAEAARQGLTVSWRTRNGEAHDLIVSGKRVDAKATMQKADGSWRYYWSEPLNADRGARHVAPVSP